MATHSSILAWRILWTQEPGRLQSMGSQESDTTERLNHHCRQIIEKQFLLFIYSWLPLLQNRSSWVRGFSSCSMKAQQLWHVGLAAPGHVKSSCARDRACVSYPLWHQGNPDLLVLIHGFPEFSKGHYDECTYWLMIQGSRKEQKSFERQN